MWSLGFCITALVAAGMRQAAVSIELHSFIVLVTVLIAGSIVFSGIENAPGGRTLTPEIRRSSLFPRSDCSRFALSPQLRFLPKAQASIGRRSICATYSRSNPSSAGSA